jgi:hypothetical protein
MVNGNLLSTATGFIVEHQGKLFLVTNWHVLSGRNAETDKPLSSTGGIPDEVRIAHHLKNRLGTWQFQGESLVASDGSPLWLAHPAGSKVDVAALELKNVRDNFQVYPFDLTLAGADIHPQPAMPISVIGFPLGLRPNAFFPIWKTGHIATDPDLDHGGRPAFLIDATTRNGMSGSPVVIRISGPYMNSRSEMMVGIGGVQTRFLDIYSGRIHDDAEIGCVWRPHVISELLEAHVYEP